MADACTGRGFTVVLLLLSIGTRALWEMPAFQGWSQLCGEVSWWPSGRQQLHLQVRRGQQWMSSLPRQLHARVSESQQGLVVRRGQPAWTCLPESHAALNIQLDHSYVTCRRKRKSRKWQWEEWKRESGKSLLCSPFLRSHWSLYVIFNKGWIDIILYLTPRRVYVTSVCVISPLLSDSRQLTEA